MASSRRHRGHQNAPSTCMGANSSSISSTLHLLTQVIANQSVRTLRWQLVFEFFFFFFLALIDIATLEKSNFNRCWVTFLLFLVKRGLTIPNMPQRQTLHTYRTSPEFSQMLVRGAHILVQLHFNTRIFR